MSGLVKIHQIPLVIFETTSQFFFKLCITLQCHERQLFCTFLATIFRFGQKEPIKSQNFITLKIDAKFEEKLICCFKNDKNLVNFGLNTRNSWNFYFDWFLLCKVYNVWPKKVQRSYLSWHWRVMQNLKKNRLLVWKMTVGIWQIFTRALEKSQNWDFDGIFLSKVENVWP